MRRTIATEVVQQVELAATDQAFALHVKNGRVATWGGPSCGGDCGQAGGGGGRSYSGTGWFPFRLLIETALERVHAHCNIVT